MQTYCCPIQSIQSGKANRIVKRNENKKKILMCGGYYFCMGQNKKGWALNLTKCYPAETAKCIDMY